MKQQARSTAVAWAAQQRHWREADARIVISAWRRSGESQVAFAHRHGLDPKRIGRWAARLTRAERAGDPSPSCRSTARTTALRFHPVRVVAPTRSGSEGAASVAPIEVATARGVVIRVPPGVAPADLRQVLSAVAEQDWPVVPVPATAPRGDTRGDEC